MTTYMEKELKVLAIDGGGMRGYYSLKILECIERELGIETHSYFNGFAGTSTGSIISGGLYSGKSIKDIEIFYQEIGKKIFPKAKLSVKLPFLGTVDTLEIKQLLTMAKYDDAIFRKVYSEFIYDKILTSDEKKIAITSYNISKKEAYIFENMSGSHEQVKLVDAVLASSAAPSFLAPQEILLKGETHLFYDGGLISNNPTLATLPYWLDYSKDQAFTSIKILSISTYNPIKIKTISIGKTHSLLNMKYDLLDIFLYSQSLATDQFLSHNYSIDGIPVSYYRIGGCNENVPPSKIEVQMDTATKDGFLLMTEHAEAEFNKCKPEIKEFLNAGKAE